jgi:hypothetical protein
MAWFFFDILERFACALASGESETIWQLTMPSVMALETAWRKGLWIWISVALWAYVLSSGGSSSNTSVNAAWRTHPYPVNPHIQTFNIYYMICFTSLSPMGPASRGRSRRQRCSFTRFPCAWAPASSSPSGFHACARRPANLRAACACCPREPAGWQGQIGEGCCMYARASVETRETQLNTPDAAMTSIHARGKKRHKGIELLFLRTTIYSI